MVHEVEPARVEVAPEVSLIACQYFWFVVGPRQQVDDVLDVLVSELHRAYVALDEGLDDVCFTYQIQSVRLQPTSC